MAQQLHRSNRLEEAETVYRDMLRAGVQVPQCVHFLGLIYLERGDLERGRRLLEQAICLDLANALFLTNFGLAVERFGEPEFAFRIHLRAARTDPLFDIPVFNSATLLSKGSSSRLALDIFRKCITLGPARFDTYINLASNLYNDRRYADATHAYYLAERLSPTNSDVRFSAAIVYLTMGEFPKGWDRYESRWTASLHTNRVHHSVLLRQSRRTVEIRDELKSARTLVWAEQGIGDEVMFGGLLREFRGLCGEMLLQVDRRLKGLFERSLPGVQVYARDEKVPEELYDEQIPMGSLGQWLRPSRESFEGKGGRYLAAQEGLGARLRAQLGVKAEETLVGLSWRSASPETGAARSIGLKELAVALSARAGVRFVNLQYGEVGEEIEALRRESGIEVLSHAGIDNREDLEGLAGLIEGCDLVVSVGNATAHLSGALGQRTWVLLPPVAGRLPSGRLVGGWRWLHSGKSCLWYQSVIVFRQPTIGSWGVLLDKLRQELDRGQP